MNIAWSGLADEKYWEYIAKFCVPSWKKLPGDKYIITDSDQLNLSYAKIIKQENVLNNNAKFLKMSDNKKQGNFWRKMQSQVWALRNLKQYDWLVLLDTDVEILDFDQDKFYEEIENLKKSNLIWATGQSQLRKLDAGHIIINMRHPQLADLTNHYENIWETGNIFKLNRPYDGDAVESMFSIYPSYRLKNRDYGKGLHLYDFGTVHWGSKEPKSLRNTWNGDGKNLVEKRLSEIVIKKYKSDN
jgi:hypothetical protein